MSCNGFEKKDNGTIGQLITHSTYNTQQFEQAFSTVDIVDKTDMTVPIWFLPWHLKARRRLIRFRTQAGVACTNMFNCLQSIRESLRWQCISTVWCTFSTILVTNKQVATLCHILNLKEPELDLLASYTGYGITTVSQTSR